MMAMYHSTGFGYALRATVQSLTVTQSGISFESDWNQMHIDVHESCIHGNVAVMAHAFSSVSICMWLYIPVQIALYQVLHNIC
jgi:hypothetical protein